MQGPWGDEGQNLEQVYEEEAGVCCYALGAKWSQWLNWKIDCTVSSASWILANMQKQSVQEQPNIILWLSEGPGVAQVNSWFRLEAVALVAHEAAEWFDFLGRGILTSWRTCIMRNLFHTQM